MGDKFTHIEWNIFLYLGQKKELWNEKINLPQNQEQFNAFHTLFCLFNYPF